MMYDGSMTPEKENERKEWLVNMLYVIVVAINVYIVVDQATDGALSREASMKLYRLRGHVSNRIKQEKEYKEEAGKVVWEAMTIVEGNNA